MGKLAKQERLLSSCLAREMTLKADVMLATNTTKAALDKVTACQGKKATMGQHEQFKTFKSFVYGKLATVVKTSSLAIERERNVTSTVRKENSAFACDSRLHTRVRRVACSCAPWKARTSGARRSSPLSCLVQRIPPLLTDTQQVLPGYS